MILISARPGKRIFIKMKEKGELEEFVKKNG